MRWDLKSSWLIFSNDFFFFYIFSSSINVLLYDFNTRLSCLILVMFSSIISEKVNLYERLHNIIQNYWFVKNKPKWASLCIHKTRSNFFSQKKLIKYGLRIRSGPVKWIKSGSIYLFNLGDELYNEFTIIIIY